MKRALSVLFLFVLIFSALQALSACGGKPAAAPENSPAVQETPAGPESDPAAEAPEPAPDRGTLLDSGTGLNENYYGKLDISGCAAVHVTDSGFDLEPKALGTDQKTVSVRYDENTLFRTADLYYHEDRYEVYAGVLEDFLRLKDEPLYNIGVVLDDPGAEELYAKEIWIDSMVDLV